MPNIYSFQRLIEKYSVPFELEVDTAGYWDDLGEWKEGILASTSQTGALVPLTQRQIYQSGGRYTDADRTLIIHRSVTIPPKAKIHYKGQTYHVEALIPYEDYADFNSYSLKHVSAFDEVTP
jgi:hypothetical protein